VGEQSAATSALAENCRLAKAGTRRRIQASFTYPGLLKARDFSPGRFNCDANHFANERELPSCI
jgi:hypothetical protein